MVDGKKSNIDILINKLIEHKNANREIENGVIGIMLKKNKETIVLDIGSVGSPTENLMLIEMARDGLIGQFRALAVK